VRRVLQSATFRNATTLQQLFQFLSAKTIGGTPEALKEYTIGVEALGRKPDFDPKIDPIVRVQSHRLRLKLKEYYDIEGIGDPILIQIPKGHYLPTFEFATTSKSELDRSSGRRTYTGIPGAIHDEELKAHSGTPEIGASNKRFNGIIFRLAAFAVVLVSLFTIGFWLGERRAKVSTDSNATLSGSGLDLREVPDPVRKFWTTFLGNDSTPVIAYPDAVFLLDDSNDLFRFRQGASDSRGALVDPHLARQFASNPRLVAMAGQLYYENGYTGTGELESVGMLAVLLGRMGVRPTIKSSRDVTPDDLKQHNVILLGSPFQNVAVAQLLPTGDFTFQNPDSRHEQWRAHIINANPQANEQPTYGTERDQTTHALKTDYSIITFAPGVVSGRYIAILGGLDTKGTEGATTFATSEQGIDELTRILATGGLKAATGEPLTFQALVRVRLAKGYQVLGADLTAVHKLHAPLVTGSNNPTAAEPTR
jgi:hypothetical protein